MVADERKKAYKPKRPFKCVEGIGSEPWKRMSRNAVFVVIKLYGEFNGYNRYDLSLTYKEIKEKMSSRLFSKAIWEAVGFGFVDIRRFGRLEHNCSIYGISDRWRQLKEVQKLDEIEVTLKRIERLSREKSS